jgi:quercetin dioxygenase-like cupin family protein
MSDPVAASAPSPEVRRLADLVGYQEGSVVSRMLLKKKTGSVTLFAFGQGEGLSEHTAPFEALVVVLEGAAEIGVAGVPYPLGAGETITLPAGIPHTVRAATDFKMLLVMLREEAAAR